MWEKNYDQKSYCYKNGKNIENAVIDSNKQDNSISLSDVIHFIFIAILIYILKTLKKRLKKIKL